MTSNDRGGATTTTGTTEGSGTPSGSLATQPKTVNRTDRGEIVIKSFEGFLSFVIGVSIFGASTFTVVVSQIADPSSLYAKPRFTAETVRTFLAISWLLFILALGIVGFSMSVVTFQREHAKLGQEGEWIKRWKGVGLLVSSVIELLIVVAFIFLSLVIVAYAEAVGWVAVGCASVAAILVIVLIAIQWV
jgi:hypothetical protein